VKFRGLNAINCLAIKCRAILVLKLKLNSYWDKYLDDVVSPAAAVAVVVGVACLFR
jgi:hypothetical protein